MMPVPVDVFLSKIKEIIDEAPRYKLGGFGLNGVCDCIGLIIGALRRAGAGWGKVHGSNYALRYEMRKVFQVAGPCDLYPGLAMFKFRRLGERGYKLPSIYAGHPDQLDYYHVGIVIGVNPLQIAHCTSWRGGSGIKIDTQVGAWKIAAEPSRVIFPGTKPQPLPQPQSPTPKASAIRIMRYTPGLPYMRGDDIKAVQQALKAKGYNPGVLDGIYGAKTKAAVRLFQLAAFPSSPSEWDGIVGPKTYAKLGVRANAG